MGRAKISKDASMPKKDELLLAMDSAKNSIEAADYLVKRTAEIIESFLRKNPDLKKKALEVLDAVKDFAKKVGYKLAANQEQWNGIPDSSEYQKLHTGLADDAMNDLNIGHAFEKVTLIYAISNEGNYVRGYKGMDAAQSKDLDKLFNAWLAENNISNFKGELFRIALDEKGNHQIDKNGNPILEKNERGENIKLGVEEVEKLMTSKGFGDYLAEKAGITLISAQREYKDEQRLAQKAQEREQKALQGIQEISDKVDKSEVDEGYQSGDEKVRPDSGGGMGGSRS